LSDIERHPLTEHYVFMAMHNQLRKDLAPHLAAGEVVLVDRSPLSDWAYQKFGGQLDSMEFERDLDQSMELFVPDSIICYAVDYGTIATRVRARREGAKLDYFESKPADYFERVIEGYRFAASRYNAIVLDATRSIEEIHTDTMTEINRVLAT
jgi:thymidylate kinase